MGEFNCYGVSAKVGVYFDALVDIGICYTPEKWGWPRIALGTGTAGFGAQMSGFRETTKMDPFVGDDYFSFSKMLEVSSIKSIGAKHHFVPVVNQTRYEGFDLGVNTRTERDEYTLGLYSKGTVSDDERWAGALKWQGQQKAINVLPGYTMLDLGACFFNGIASVIAWFGNEVSGV